jgi:hypothetical protein
VDINHQNEELPWLDDFMSDSESSSGSSFVRARMSDSGSDSESDSDDKPSSPNLCWLTTPFPNGVLMLESNDLENSGEKSPGWGSLWSISPKEKNPWEESPYRKSFDGSSP